MSENTLLRRNDILSPVFLFHSTEIILKLGGNGRINSQHSWVNFAGSCCACVRVVSVVEMDATTPNIVGPSRAWVYHATSLRYSLQGDQV